MRRSLIDTLLRWRTFPTSPTLRASNRPPQAFLYIPKAEEEIIQIVAFVCRELWIQEGPEGKIVQNRCQVDETRTLDGSAEPKISRFYGIAVHETVPRGVEIVVDPSG
jgi:hypothetical protein